MDQQGMTENGKVAKVGGIYLPTKFHGELSRNSDAHSVAVTKEQTDTTRMSFLLA